MPDDTTPPPEDQSAAAEEQTAAGEPTDVEGPTDVEDPTDVEEPSGAEDPLHAEPADDFAEEPVDQRPEDPEDVGGPEESPATGASEEDLPTTGEADSPTEAISEEAAEGIPPDTQVAADQPAEVEAVVGDAGAPGMAGPEDHAKESGEVGLASVDDEVDQLDAATPDPSVAADATEVEGEASEEPEEIPEEVDEGEQAAAGSEEEPAAADDLDDLLDMAGAPASSETTTAAGEAAADTADARQQEVAEDEQAEQPPGDEDRADEDEQGAGRPRVRRRPTSIEDVEVRRDLMRMRGDWFVVHTYSGYEKRVKDNLENRVEALEADDRVYEIVIPTEEVIEFKKGKKTTTDKKFLPGYVLVRMDMDDETFGIVRNTPAVTGFVGSPGTRPVPLPIREVAATLKIPDKLEEETEEEEAGGAEPVEKKPQIETDLEVGETIKVTTGPFADFQGTIDEINLDQAKVRVLVSVFGRETPLELPFDNVAKL